MKHLIRWLANAGYLIAGLLFSPIAIYRILFERRYLRGWRNRAGFIPKPTNNRPVIWFHAVSMGEVNAAKPLIDKLRQQLPFYDIYVGTNTDTGYDRAVSLFGKNHVFFSPFDFSFTIRNAINRLNPAIILLMELEVWPNMVSIANEKNIPVSIVNGRITERSARRYSYLGPIVKWIFRQITLVLAQDDIYAERFTRLGVTASKQIVSGSLKWDGANLSDTIPGTDELAQALGIDPNRPLLVAGQTGDDFEEETVIRCYHQLRSKWSDLQLAIIPRKPERFDHVAKLISARGFHVVRRTNHPDGSSGPGRMVAGKPTVVLGDTMGELRKFYSLSTITFVGRTLVPMGGSDVMEVAALGNPIIVGPYYSNFNDAVQKLIWAGAAKQVNAPEKLATIISDILSNEDQLKAMSSSAKDVVVSNQGATAKSAIAICKILDMDYDQTEQNIATPRLK